MQESPRLDFQTRAPLLVLECLTLPVSTPETGVPDELVYATCRRLDCESVRRGLGCF
jgi:hypothetical protein